MQVGLKLVAVMKSSHEHILKFMGARDDGCYNPVNLSRYWYRDPLSREHCIKYGFIEQNKYSHGRKPWFSSKVEISKAPTK